VEFVFCGGISCLVAFHPNTGSFSEPKHTLFMSIHIKSILYSRLELHRNI